MNATLMAPSNSLFSQDSTSLGQQLVGAKLLTQDELENVLHLHQSKGARMGEAVIQLGLLTEDQLLPFISQQLDMPVVRLREGLIDPDVVGCIPKETAERLNVIAMFRVRDTLTVAMTEPQNLRQIDEIERVTKLRVRPVFAFLANIERMVSRAYQDDFEVDTVTADLDGQAVEINADAAELDTSQIESMVEGSPVINLVNYLILQALRKGASDIHIEPARKNTIVRFRVDGQLVEMLRPRRDIHPAIVSRIKVMGKMDIAEHRVPQDGRCQVSVEGKDVDLRISTLPTVLGEKVVIRVLDRRRLTFNLDELGVPQSILGRIKSLLSKPHGLLLVTGPTGSGKTTTLYSALELIKSVQSNIVTVEDPVEYQLDMINQVQVDKARTLGFAGALRAILRQDPDVIMVGEIRDGETAQVAVQSAMTGHLVLSTLHTNDSPGAITRLRDMDVEPFKIASALLGAIAQRLLRTICPKCKSTYYPPAELLRELKYDGDTRKAFLRGEGCRECYDTGFQGRTGIYEVLSVDNEVRDLIMSNSNVDLFRAALTRQGGQPLLYQGMKLAEQEITSIEEVTRVAFVD